MNDLCNFVRVSSPFETTQKSVCYSGYGVREGLSKESYENKTESIFITISYRNQLQEKSCKKHKYMKAKQYATKSPNEK